MRNPLTIEDLKRVYIRVGARNVNLYEATDQEFDDWAKSCTEIRGKDNPWNLEERRAFCDILWQAGALHMI